MSKKWTKVAISRFAFQAFTIYIYQYLSMKFSESTQNCYCDFLKKNQKNWRPNSEIAGGKFFKNPNCVILQRTCNLRVQIKWCWFNYKMFIFGQVMAKKWRSCPYLGICFGLNSVIFVPIGLKFFMGAQKTIIYRLVMRNPSFDAYFSFLIFWAKMGVATTRAPNGLGPPKFTKKLADWADLFGRLLSRNLVFEIFRV